MATAKDARGIDVIAHIGIARVVATAALVIVALAIQSTLLSQATLLGVIPQLVLVVIVSLAYADGPRVGVVTGFAAGLLIDLQLPNSIGGLTALVYTLVGYSVGTMRQYAPHESVWAPVLAVMLASAVTEVGYATLSIMMGTTFAGLGVTAKIAGLVVLYNTLLAPFVYPLVRRIATRFSPEKVHQL